MKRRKIHLYAKLILILAVTFGAVFVVSLYGMNSQQQILLERLTQSQISKVGFFESTLTTEVSRLQNSANACVNDEDFIKLAVFSDVFSDYKRSETINNLRKKMILLREMSPYMNSISVYMPALGRSVNTINCDSELSQADVDALRQSQQNGEALAYHQGRLLVSAAYPVGTAEPYLLMAIEVSQAELRNMLASMETSERSGALLLREDWYLSPEELPSQLLALMRGAVYAPGAGDTDAQTLRWQGEDFLFAWVRCPALDACLVSYVPQAQVTSQLQAGRNWISLMVVAASVLVACAAMLEFTSVHLPIQRMVQAFRAVEQGDRHIRLQTDRKDEFGDLYASFNHMLATIDGLINQVYRQRMLYQQAQLKQLQTQINPHFFYNSFFTAQGMLDMGEYEAASEMLGALGRYFQFITRNGQAFIPLERELAHAQTYCEVQQIRFADIDVRIEALPPAWRDVLVPRLILQPLIENAYAHGLEDMPQGGMLCVGFEPQGEDLLIHVCNNGHSLPPEELRILQARLEAQDDGEQEITGMINIHRRLRLYYGPGYGLSIQPWAPCGAHVTLRIRNKKAPDSPAQKEHAYVPLAGG